VGTPLRAGRARGFTLVDTLIACAIAGVLATVALPSYQGSVQKARRADAVAALTRLEFSQGSFRANNGLYSADLNALGLRTGLSAEGHYRITIHLLGADGYEANASVVEGGAQQHDTECAVLTLQVRQERVTRGPARHCWLR
jgi:type IV pilus assembly protein PilE